MSVSILENIKVNNLESSDTSQYINLVNNKLEVQKMFCPMPGHTDDSIKNLINTGFATDDSLMLTPCSDKPLSQPLLKENYLSEFKTEEQKLLARNNLGLYNEKDVVGLSLLTTSTELNNRDLFNINIKSLEQGKIPFAVQTIAKAVMVQQQDNTFVNLQQYLENSVVDTDSINKRIDKIINRSEIGMDLNTLGDIMSFLSGYKNNESLQEIIKDIKNEYLIFENLGEI